MAKLIELRDVYKIYSEGLESEVRALDGVSLTIDRGEFVAIVGQSGSGKSTMMNVLGCLDVPTYGEYLLEGTDVSELSDMQLSRIRNKEIGFIFQQYNLIQSLSVQENVELPLVYQGIGIDDRHELAIEALERVGLVDRRRNKPTQMSGGQQQRVAIARALVCEPRVLLLDKNAYEAALDLGATPRQALHRVILPEIMPGIVTGGIMAFTMSVDDFVVSYFTAGTTSQPLSVVIYSMTRHRMTPKINAVSTLLFLFVLVLLIVINVRQSRDEKRREAARREAAS